MFTHLYIVHAAFIPEEMGTLKYLLSDPLQKTYVNPRGNIMWHNKLETPAQGLVYGE